MSAYGFDSTGAGRVVDTVRRSEGGTVPVSASSNVDGASLPGWRPPYLLWVKITAYTVNDSPAKNRWKYTVTQVNKSATGYDGWTAVTDATLGIVGATAYNFIEQMNVAADTSSPTILGNGINVDGSVADTSFTLQPAPVNLILPAWVVLVQENATTQTRELWFNYENQFDGEC